MKTCLILCLSILATMLSVAAIDCEAATRNAEFFYYVDSPGADGKTDFYGGGVKEWGADQRIDYLRHYADFLKGYFGGLKLDEYATKPDEVERTIKNLKPQPETRVRRERELGVWRLALSDDGESLGWTAREFDDSAWERTESLPKVAKGTETRDLWMRAALRTGDYEKAFIDFEGILGDSEMWVNGKKVIGPDAFHANSAPFRVDLTSWLDKNADNQITVHVKDYKQRGESGSPDEPSKLIGWGSLGARGWCRPTRC